jgi:16S rRNA G966 N2-methylase RsmD
MDWQSLKQPDIQNFMRAHEDADVSALALKKPPAKDWPYPLILDQIKARQKARIKVPDWLETETILPASSLVEQASSEATARHKATLVSGETFIDLTTGMGIDSAAFAANFKNGFCIERDQTAAELLRYNFEKLGLSNLETINTTAEDFVKTMPDVDLVYIDPQRRDERQKGKFMLESTSPDIRKLLPLLKNKTKKLMIKTSPMLDIAQSCAVLETIAAVHILEWRGDCKEVLYILDFQNHDDIAITATVIDDHGEALKSLRFTTGEEHNAICEFSLPLTYVFEPSPALQKSGAFKTIAPALRPEKAPASYPSLYQQTTMPRFPRPPF